MRLEAIVLLKATFGEFGESLEGRRVRVVDASKFVKDVDGIRAINRRGVEFYRGSALVWRGLETLEMLSLPTTYLCVISAQLLGLNEQAKLLGIINGSGPETLLPGDFEYWPPEST